MLKPFTMASVQHCAPGGQVQTEFSCVSDEILGEVIRVTAGIQILPEKGQLLPPQYPTVLPQKDRKCENG